MDYVRKSGQAARLDAAEFRLVWADERDITRLIDLEGWRKVIERDAQGRFCSFRVNSVPRDLILLKKRR